MSREVPPPALTLSLAHLGETDRQPEGSEDVPEADEPLGLAKRWTVEEVPPAQVTEKIAHPPGGTAT